MIVDFHTHIFSPEVINNRGRYLQADPGFASLYSRPSARLASADELVDSMDKNGIDMSVVCGFGWSTQELCSQANDYMLASIARHPGRLVGLATLRPEEGEAALTELERCYRGGIRGIGEMRPPGAALDSTFDSLWTPLVKTLIEHRMLCLFHTSEPVGHPYPGKGNLTPEVLYPFITRYPGLRFVLAHWGGGLPFYTLMPEVKRNLSNTWFDTAASSYLYESKIYEMAVAASGPDRILFGSDFPLMPQSRPLKEIGDTNLQPEDRAKILGGNARKLLEVCSG